MKPVKTKKEIRDEINRQVDEFLSSGGNVQQVKQGISGNETNTHIFKNTTSFSPKQERTPVTDVIKELDSRKSAKPNTSKTSYRRPKKKLITDDFGDPIRWVWEE